MLFTRSQSSVPVLPFPISAMREGAREVNTEVQTGRPAAPDANLALVSQIRRGAGLVGLLGLPAWSFSPAPEGLCAMSSQPFQKPLQRSSASGYSTNLEGRAWLRACAKCSETVLKWGWG